MPKAVRKSSDLPAQFGQAHFDEVCRRISLGDTLAQICRDIDFSRSTVHDWKNSSEARVRQFARARDDGFDAIAEQTVEIAHMAPAYKVGPDGSSIDQGDVSNRKLQIETRLKLLAKWDPKRYGDRTQHEHTGKLTLESLVTGDGPKE